MEVGSVSLEVERGKCEGWSQWDTANVGAGHGEGGGYLQCRNVGLTGDKFQSRAGHTEGRNAFLKSIDGYYRQG